MTYNLKLVILGGGSEIHKKVTRIDLVCPGTIDEIVNTALMEKTIIGEMILLNYGKSHENEE